MHFSAVFSWLLPLEFLRLWSLSSCCGSTWSLMVSQQLPLDLTHLTLTSWRNLPETPRKALSLDGSSSDTWLLEVSFLKLTFSKSFYIQISFQEMKLLVVNTYWICISVYVGCATVGAAAWWFMVYDQGPQLNYYQLVRKLKLKKPIIYLSSSIYWILYEYITTVLCFRINHHSSHCFIILY